MAFKVVVAVALAAPSGAAALADMLPLQVQMDTPQHILSASPSAASPSPGVAETFVRHPWPIRDRDAELRIEATGEAPPPSRNVITKDGVQFTVSAAPAVLPATAVAAVYVGLFSISLTGSEERVEAFMQEGGLPPPHNPLRMSNLFRHQFPSGLQVDELGDACIGETFRVEFCARVQTCFLVTGAEGGGGRWRIAAHVPFASGYRVEVYLADASPACRDHQSTGQYAADSASSFAWWAPAVAEHKVPSLAGVAQYAAYARFRLLHVNQASFWWSHNAQVDPVTAWSDMMRSAVEGAAASPAASPELHGLPVPPNPPHGLWLEFGVGSGKTTAYIAYVMQTLLGNGATLHGFDSFQGLPTSWAHTKLGAGTFSMGGKVPEHLQGLDNVQVHVGLFSETLADLDEVGDAPVAFAHVDVDLYASAVEVLSRIACQLYPGSVLVFDELVNYAGFELSGEYRAWEYISAVYGLAWDYAGLFWQQAVPVIITQRGSAC